MDVVLEPATVAAVPVLERLLQLYEYDFSEYGGVDLDEAGLFPTLDTAAISGADDRPFLVRVGGALAGFALVTRHEAYLGGGRVNLLAELFVVRRHRRRGVGERIARELFDRFPGRWELATATGNLGAQAFWRRVLGRYRPDHREVADGCARWAGPIWTFEA